jgi:hypothetical protein
MSCPFYFCFLVDGKWHLESANALGGDRPGGVASRRWCLPLNPGKL